MKLTKLLEETNPAQLLTVLQHGDSLFPSGANAISGGLETLVSEGHVKSANDVSQFVFGQLNHRWKNFDRPALVAAHRCADNLKDVADIDALVDAQTLCASSRSGSIRVGRGLLDVHIKLNTKYAEDYGALVARSQAFGHNVVVQGLMWRGLGLTEASISLMSAYTFSNGLVSAALRLGVIGHIAAQKILSDTVDTVQELVSCPPADMDAMYAFTPGQEIYTMRQVDLTCRLFAN